METEENVVRFILGGLLFVVYTERVISDENDKAKAVIRLISARLATNFERDVYYGKRS